jgi:5-oxoprolinase (ATP-hydrolysing)
VDFTGPSTQRADNFNAPAAVCTAAVLYVFRTLVDADIPLNAGCLKPIRIVVPAGSLLDPTYPAAVAAGNVETSQAITSALFGALGVVAASQTTMNNVTFGDARYQYYETVCGVVRRLRFLEPLTAAVVSSGRRVPPYGLAGGLPGAPGRNAVERAGGEVEELPGVAQIDVRPGDVLVVETPGGGGFGAPPA